MHKYKIVYRPLSPLMASEETIEAESIRTETGRVVFSAYDRRGAVPEPYVVLSVHLDEVLSFGRIIEPVADDDLPAKPLVKRPESLALFKVEFRDQDLPDALIWAENAKFENGRPPTPLCNFYATLQTGTLSLLRSIWSDRIAEVTCIRPPESAA